MTVQEAKFIMAESLDRFMSRNKTINLNQLQAECINNSCLYYLKEKNKAYSGLNAFAPFNTFEKINPAEIGKTFGLATQEMIPQFNDAMVTNAALATVQNVGWDEMWEFLEKYFQNTHGIDINNV